MAATFAEKFEQALADRKAKDPDYGLRTLARTIANDDLQQAEIIRRRLYKYRPPKGGGSAIVPTESTRREIEKAMGLKRDALKPDAGQAAAMVDDLMAQLAPMRAAARLADMVERGELVVAR